MLDSLLSHARAAGYTALEKVLWLYFAAENPATPAWARATIYSTLGYVVLPLDAIPDPLPGGFTDDAAAVALALATVATFVDDEVRDRARKTLTTWFGPGDDGAACE